MAVIDASGHVLGRLSSVVAKRLLDGEEIVVVNAEKILITGRRDRTLADYKHTKDRGLIRKGPYFPRRADLIMKRTVRGMVPIKKPHGKTAINRLHVYVGVPKDYESVKAETVELAMSVNTARYITLGDVSEFLGSKVR